MCRQEEASSNCVVVVGKHSALTCFRKGCGALRRCMERTSMFERSWAFALGPPWRVAVRQLHGGIGVLTR
eukprot:9202645-Alexandrium_andersonii.AAC.1